MRNSYCLDGNCRANQGRFPNTKCVKHIWFHFGQMRRKILVDYLFFIFINESGISTFNFSSLSPNIIILFGKHALHKGSKVSKVSQKKKKNKLVK